MDIRGDVRKNLRSDGLLRLLFYCYTINIFHSIHIPIILDDD